MVLNGFPGGSDGKAPACSMGDPGSIPGSGRSPGEGNGNPLQYSCLENSMDGGAWWATVHGVAKSRTRLSDFTSLRLNPISVSSEEDGKGDLTHTEEAMGRQGQRLEGCSHEPRNTQSWKRREGSSLEPSERVHACVHAHTCSIVSNSLRPHGLKHTRLSCPSLFYLLELAQTHVH